MCTRFYSHIHKALSGIMRGIFIATLSIGNLSVVSTQEFGLVPSTTSQITPLSNTPILSKLREISFTLDDVDISVHASYLPTAEITVSEPGSTSQVATSATWKPFREFSIIAIPFGYKPGSEAVPVARAGLRDVYDFTLRNYRKQQGGIVQDRPTATLFGKQVTGIRTLVELPIDGPILVPVMIEEWVVQAGDRLWIVRTSEEQLPGVFTSQSVSFLKDLIVDSNTLSNPSTLGDKATETSDTEKTPEIEDANPSNPSWWHGDCDYETYFQGSGGIAPYRLGAVYLGMPACGPRPWFDGTPNVLAHFFPGSWGVLEWQCTELAMRFLYLIYGINPYQANGSQVVWNYSGNRLVKISNGTAGKAPQPNDILSYGSTSTSGHASIVTSSNIDGNGNGTITVIEQNSSPSGSNTLSVNNWVVTAWSTISGWLHDNTSITISGNVGVAGATLSYDDGGPMAATAESSGKYTFTVSYNWSGKVTPSKAGYTFTPASIEYTNVLADQTGQNYTATSVATFLDVPDTYWAWSEIERLYVAGFTTGCSDNPLAYCPERSVTRAEMAIFIERGMNTATYTPPPATGTVFVDVPLSYWDADWIEKLFADHITGGCGVSPLTYCPDSHTTRAEMAVFLLRAKYGAAYNPPAAAGIFADVSTTYWDASWIEQLYAEGITGGCSLSPLSYCPEKSVTRAEMAVFLVRTFNLP